MLPPCQGLEIEAAELSQNDEAEALMLQMAPKALQ